MKNNKDTLYEDQEEELVYFLDIEDVFVKKYDIVCYAKINEGMTLSVKGEGIGSIIWYNYSNGSLIAESISDGSGTEKRSVTDNDKELIRDINRYDAAQQFSHFVLSNSK